MDGLGKKLLKGELVIVGNKIYGMCQNCGDIVQLNRFLIGSLHVCIADTTDNEKNS